MDPSRRTVWLALVVASAVVGTMLNAGLASGRTAAATSVTGLYMDGSGFPAGGGPVNVGPSATYTAAIALDPSVLNMSVTGGGVSLTFTFASAPGTTITTGTYTNAVRASFRGPGQNGLDVTSGSTGCSTVSGQFTVLELATDGTGAVTATAVDFEIHCESQQPAAFGSIRFQSTQGYRGIKIDPYPVPQPLAIGSAIVGDTVSKTIAITSTGTDPLTISTVAVAGSDFAIDSEDCTTTSPLASGSACSITVAFTPSAVGQRSGTLSIGDNALAGGHTFGVGGNGLAGGLAPDSLNFGDVDVFTAAPLKVITLHTGPTPLTGINPSIVTNSASFSIAAKTCGTTLAANGSCTFSIRYLPEILGADQAALFVQTNELGQLGLNIYGTGQAGTNISWSRSHSLGNYRWNDGAGLAGTTTVTSSYLHSVMASALVGSKPVRDSGPREPILYRRSSNGGTTWTRPFRVNPTTQHGDRASAASSGSYVYVAWVKLGKVIRYSHTAPRVIYFRANRANGLSTRWGPIHRLSSLIGRVDFPVVAASGNSVYVVWTNGRSGAIRIAISRNHGRTWVSSTIGMTTRRSADGRNGYPWIGASGLRLTVAWVSNPGGAVVARTSITGGSTWLPADTLSTASDGLVSSAVRSNRSAVAWSAGRTIHIGLETDATWASDVSVPPPGSSTYFSAAEAPVVALQGDASVGVAWSACVAPCTSRPKIDLIWAESSDQGATWGRQDIGWYAFGYGLRKRFPSVLWSSPTARYISWNGDGDDPPLLAIEAGAGSP